MRVVAGRRGAGRTRRRSAPLFAAVLVLVTLARLEVSGAAFTATTADSGNDWAATSLQPASDLSAAQVCTNDPVPALRASSTSSAVADGLITISRPAGVVAGDVMLAALGSAGTPDLATIVPPSGWTLLDAASSSITQAVYLHRATASEPADYTWTYPTPGVVGGIVAYSGVHPKFPVNAHASLVNPNQNLVSAPSVTTTTTNTRLVGFFALGSPGSWTPPSGTVEHWDIRDGSMSQASASEPLTEAGSTGTRSATSSVGGRGVGTVVALAPSATPSASLTWTASPSTITTGYRLDRLVAGAVQATTTVTGRTTTTAADGPLVNDTAYTYSLRATLSSWRSPSTTTTLTPDC